jgi:hypothetical protein
MFYNCDTPLIVTASQAIRTIGLEASPDFVKLLLGIALHF